MKVRAALTPEQAARWAGSWRLADAGRQTLVLTAEGDELRAALPGQFEAMRFQPESASTFFSTEPPWELRFGADGRTLTLVTWGEETAGVRAD